MKKIFLALTIILFTFVSIQAQIVVNCIGPYFVGDTIGFNKSCHDVTRGTSIWDFSDGTTITYPNDWDHGWQYHAYDEPGTYKVIYTHGWGSGKVPVCGTSLSSYNVSYNITILPRRAITATPSNPKVDQMVYLQALNFIGPTVYWNFGDGTVLNGGHIQTHRYQSTGTFIVSVRELDLKHETISTIVTVSPDDRFIQISATEVSLGEPVTVTAFNFNGDTVLWNFGDGTIVLGGQTISHIYDRTGDFKITAVDEGGESTRSFEIMVKIFGLSDEVLLEVAELKFDNGKYYIVVPKNSNQGNPLLRLKMRGTGIITGQWLVDGVPYGLVSELSRQGEVKEIRMNKSLPIPTIDPGLHTVSFRLTRPVTNVVFPTLRYYVLPYERSLDILSPPNGFVAKEDEIPEFSWKIPMGGAASYQIAFSNSLFELLYNKSTLLWNEVRGSQSFTPGKIIWDKLKRNRWSYWRVQAFDSFNKVTGESGINEMKIVIAEAEITLNKVTNLKGEEISLGKNGLDAGQEMLLIKGTIEYKDDSKYLILQVLVNDEMVDQLLFRDVKKGEIRSFETSVPGRQKGKIMFQVLKTSSPSVIVGIKGILLK